MPDLLEQALELALRARRRSGSGRAGAFARQRQMSVAQRTPHGRPQRERVERRAVDHALEHLVRVLAGKRQRPGGEPVEDGAERKDVAARVGVAALDLLGRHVRGRAEQLAGRGHGRHGGVEHVGDAEVGELHRAVLVQQHVLGLHVAVHDALRVRSGERSGQLDTDAGRDLGRHLADWRRRTRAASARSAARSRCTRCRTRARCSRRSRGWPGGCSRATARASREKRARACSVPRRCGCMTLTRDPAIEPRVAGAVHRRHPSMADLVREFVAIDARKHGRNDPV